MAAELKLILRRDFANGGLDVRMLEFDQTLALFAEQMFVLRITVIVVVIGVRTEFQFAQQAGIDQF